MGVFKRNKSQAAAEHPQQGGCLAGSELRAELGDKVESRVDPRLQIEHVEQAAIHLRLSDANKLLNHH